MLFKRKFRTCESQLYLLAWISAVIYAIYSFTVASQAYFRNRNHHVDFFSPGFSFIARWQDVADIEWLLIEDYVNSVLPWMLLQLTVCELVRQPGNTVCIQLLQLFGSAFYVIYFINCKFFMLLLAQPLMFYLVAILKRKWLVWLLNIVCLLLIALYKRLAADSHSYTSEFSMWALCWMNLRCTGLHLNHLKATKQLPFLLNYLTYCLYFPTLFTGPYIPYEHFKTFFDTHLQEEQELRLTTFAFNLTRSLFWMFFTKCCLHYVYVNATAYHLDLIEGLDLCSLCGYGYLMGQYFHLKYVVFYGLSTGAAQFENVLVPRLPRCIGRVHLYSDMWKYFDCGLYHFLKNCIFIPCKNVGVPKLFCSLLCFLFVYFWHGLEQYILVWAALNFLGVTLEASCAMLFECYAKERLPAALKEGATLRRLSSLLAAPLLAMSAISNFYFFGGQEVGDIFLTELFRGPCWGKLLVIVVLYCCSEVSTELRDIDSIRL